MLAEPSCLWKSIIHAQNLRQLRLALGSLISYSLYKSIRNSFKEVRFSPYPRFSPLEGTLHSVSAFILKSRLKCYYLC